MNRFNSLFPNGDKRGDKQSQDFVCDVRRKLNLPILSEVTEDAKAFIEGALKEKNQTMIEVISKELQIK